MKQNEEFDFKKIKNSSILFWYPPSVVNHYIEKIETKRELTEIEDDWIKTIELSSYFNKDEKGRFFNKYNSLVRRNLNINNGKYKILNLIRY